MNEQEKPKPWEVRIGGSVTINGVPLKIVNVNTGKRRLTLSPEKNWPMCTVLTDPVVSVKK